MCKLKNSVDGEVCGGVGPEEVVGRSGRHWIPGTFGAQGDRAKPGKGRVMEGARRRAHNEPCTDQANQQVAVGKLFLWALVSLPVMGRGDSRVLDAVCRM